MRGMLKLGLVLVTAMACMTCGRDAPSRGLRVGNNGVLDLGKVHCEAEPLDPASSLQLHNAADRPVRIRRLVSSCACVVPNLTVPEIPAGGSADLFVRLRPPVGRGRLKYTIYIQTDLPGQEIVPVTVKCFNVLPWMVHPASLAVSFESAGGTAERTLGVWGLPGDSGFAVRSVISNSALLVVRSCVKRKYLRNDCVVWLVRVLAHSPERGSECATISLEVEGGGGRERRDVPVALTRSLDYYAVPPSLTIAGGSSSQWATREVVIRTFGKVSPVVTAVIAEGELTASQRRTVLEDGVDFAIDVRPEEGIEPGFHVGRLLVYLEDEPQYVEVPVVLSVDSRGMP